MNKKTLAVIAAAMLGSTLSTAQAEDGVYGAVMASIVERDSSLQLDTGYGAAVLVGWPRDARLNWEANAFYNQNDVDNFPGDIPSYGGGLDLRYSLSEGRTRPFVLGGLGGLVDDLKDVGGKRESAPFVDLGLGLTSKIGETHALRAELRSYVIHYRRFPGDNTIFDFRFNIGVSFGGGQASAPAAPAAAPAAAAAAPAAQPAAAVAATPAPATKPAVIDKFALKGVTFDTASDKLTAKSTPKLDAVVATLKANPDVKVDIHGYTDSRGDAAKNLKLSQRRTESVKKYLVDHGIDAGRLTATGHGAADPIDTNDTPAGRANNRRVELIAR